MDKCLIGKSIDEIVNYLDVYFTVPQPDYTGGSMLGLRAAWYLDDEMPLYRGSDHAVVFSVECDWQEEEELIARLKPVDFARKGKVMVFVCYKEDGKGYSEAFREERLKEYRLDKGD